MFWPIEYKLLRPFFRRGLFFLLPVLPYLLHIDRSNKGIPEYCSWSSFKARSLPLQPIRLLRQLHSRQRKQCTRVTTPTGRQILETRSDAGILVVAEAEPSGGGGCGYVQDPSLDLQVGVVKPWLLLGSQDAAHDLDILRKYKWLIGDKNLMDLPVKAGFKPLSSDLSLLNNWDNRHGSSVICIHWIS
ncbi:dual specificity protein phosphatase 19 isoform 3-T3 [Thomomys bottae]